MQGLPLQSVQDAESKAFARQEAVELLQAARQLLEDEELQENLAGVDDLCGGVLAGWQPPWLQQGVTGMDFNENMLHDSATPVQCWASALSTVIQDLWQCAREAGVAPESTGRQPCFAVVLPDTAGRDVVEKLVRLGGGEVLQETAHGRSTVPFCRLMHLNLRPNRPAESNACGQRVQTPSNGDTRRPDAVEDGRAASPDTLLRKQALMAVLGATPAVAVLANESEPKTDQKGQAEVECLEEHAAQREEGLVETAWCRSSSLPSEIRFLHLDVLQEVTSSHGEAPALILAVMKLLNQEEVWQKFAALDGFCDNLLSQWEPPWVPEDLEGEERRAARAMSLERLEREEESTVHDWAMALDGFLSFVANLAVAARLQHAFEADRLGVPGEEPETSRLSATSVVAVVVVVPDHLTDWHLEVFGPLLRAFKIFMLSEKAWRADFDGAGSVPFSVEASSRMINGSSTAP